MFEKRVKNIFSGLCRHQLLLKHFNYSCFFRILYSSKTIFVANVKLDLIASKE